MNQDHKFPKEVASARTALHDLLPNERCHLDGQVPYDPIRLPCGHIYCRLCVDDIVATAALVDRRPRCKACRYEFGNLAGPVIRGTLGERAGQLLEATSPSSAPTGPLSQSVTTLLRQYTKSEPGLQSSDDNAKLSTEIVDYKLERTRTLFPGTPHKFQVEEAMRPERDVGFDSVYVHEPFEAPPNNDGYDGIDFFDFDLWEEPLQLDPVIVQTKVNMFNLKDSNIENPEPADFKNLVLNEPPQQPERDISVLAGERFCFKGTLRDQPDMEAAVKANGGNVTGGGYKHTTYGVVGPGWKVTRSWITNGVRILTEEGFWELLERKKRAREVLRMAERSGIP